MSNLIETPSIQIKKTVVEKLSLQQNDCPVPPCTTPLGKWQSLTHSVSLSPGSSSLEQCIRLKRFSI